MGPFKTGGNGFVFLNRRNLRLLHNIAEIRGKGNREHTAVSWISTEETPPQSEVYANRPKIIA